MFNLPSTTRVHAWMPLLSHTTCMDAATQSHHLHGCRDSVTPLAWMPRLSHTTCMDATCLPRALSQGRAVHVVRDHPRDSGVATAGWRQWGGWPQGIEYARDEGGWRSMRDVAGLREAVTVAGHQGSTRAKKPTISTTRVKRCAGVRMELQVLISWRSNAMTQCPI